VDDILRHWLNHKEVEVIINEFHSEECSGHLYKLVTTQNILCVGYFWPSIFQDYIEAVKKCHPCQVFTRNMHLDPTPFHPVITVGPFTKWGVDFNVSWNTTQPQLGGIITLLWSWVILINGLRQFLSLNPMVRLQHFLYSIRLYLSSKSRRRSSLIVVVTSKTK
jgi:hypothetical protein